MTDMAREEALKIFEFDKKFCATCGDYKCDKCQYEIAYDILCKDIKRLEAYENADLIERDKALQVPTEDEEYCKCHFCNEKDYDSCMGVACIGDDEDCSIAIQYALENIPRFEPTKGSDNND